MQNIGMEKSSIDILEVPSDREISFLSKRKRQQRLEDLQDAIEGDRWVEATKDFHRQMRRKKEEELERRRIEQKRIEEGMEAHRAMLEKLRKRSNMLYNAFDALRIHKAEKTPGEYRILGYLAPRDIHPTWKCRGFRIAIYAEKVLRLVEGGSFSDGGRLHVAIPRRRNTGTSAKCQNRKGYGAYEERRLRRVREVVHEQVPSTGSRQEKLSIGKAYAPAKGARAGSRHGGRRIPMLLLRPHAVQRKA